jgi:hypothetical protein
VLAYPGIYLTLINVPVWKHDGTAPHDEGRKTDFQDLRRSYGKSVHAGGKWCFALRTTDPVNTVLGGRPESACARDNRNGYNHEAEARERNRGGYLRSLHVFNFVLEDCAKCKLGHSLLVCHLSSYQTQRTVFT